MANRFEATKRQLLEELKSTYSSGQGEIARFFLQVASINIEIEVHQQPNSSTLEALLSHFQYFICDPTTSTHLKIQYHEVLPPLHQGQLALWRLDDPEWKLTKTDFGFDILQRDFLGFSNNDLTQVVACGPQINYETFDSIDNILTLLLSEHLPRHDSLIIHAATIVLNGKAQVFFGDSGVGKSTLATKAISLGLQILSSDQIYLSLHGDKTIAVPTPVTIPEFKHGHALLLKAPFEVESLIHLVKARTSFVNRPTATDFFSRFLKQVFYQKEFAKAPHLLNLAYKLQKNVIYKGELSYVLEDGFLSEFDLLKELHSEKSQPKDTQKIFEAQT